jgi:hypothetical protein
LGLTPGNDHHCDEARQQQLFSLAPCFSTKDHLLQKCRQQPQTFDSRTLAPPERKARFWPWRTWRGGRLDRQRVSPGNRYLACIMALEEQLDMVLVGDLTAASGLAAARAWEALTGRLGRTSQRRHDRAGHPDWHRGEAMSRTRRTPPSAGCWKRPRVPFGL